mmetsp:Transcript_15934/g.53323  ORF Transcript_15934/g.53323 Transcript_15934/m.53323 type:complete len:218 (-) Transcript_15934:285-938(-)
MQESQSHSSLKLTTRKSSMMMMMMTTTTTTRSWSESAFSSDHLFHLSCPSSPLGLARVALEEEISTCGAEGCEIVGDTGSVHEATSTSTCIASYRGSSLSSHGSCPSLDLCPPALRDLLPLAVSSSSLRLSLLSPFSSHPPPSPCHVSRAQLVAQLSSAPAAPCQTPLLLCGPFGSQKLTRIAAPPSLLLELAHASLSTSSRQCPSSHACSQIRACV